ncbi:MAG: hypothetical protein PHY34_02875 [Patescibacteria group bacterium]|nr:hypothetical protein [Patescibacteria group bacterium]MDD5715402.1 hypothetical protein [Patescibacteria group bacterium]
MGVETCQNAPEVAEEIHSQNEGKIRNRELLPDGRLEITCENGMRFFLEEIKDPESPEAREFHGLLERTFDPDEVDTLEAQQNAMRENSTDASERNFDFYLKVLKNESGEVIGGMQATSSPATAEDGKKMGWSVGFGHYIVIDPACRRLGLAPELYADFYSWGESRAQQRGESLKYFVGEVVPANERNFEKDHGGGRLFLDKQEALEEIPYYQAPLDFDRTTGEPAGKPVADHLMLGRAGVRKTASPEKAWAVPREDVLACIRAVYEINNVFPVTRTLNGYRDMWQRDSVGGDPATQKALGHIKEYYQRIKDQMAAGDDQVYVLDSGIRRYYEDFIKYGRFGRVVDPKRDEGGFGMDDVAHQQLEALDRPPEPVTEDLAQWTTKPHTRIVYHTDADRSGPLGADNAYL